MSQSPTRRPMQAIRLLLRPPFNNIAFQQYGARFLARGGQAETLEGASWQRHVVIEFDSLQQARDCYNSLEYKDARAGRLGACVASITIVGRC